MPPRRTCVLGANNHEIASHGDESFPKLFVRFLHTGEDVGYYDCMVKENRTEATGDLPQSQNQTRNHPPTAP